MNNLFTGLVDNSRDNPGTTHETAVNTQAEGSLGNSKPADEIPLGWIVLAAFVMGFLSWPLLLIALSEPIL